MPIGKFREEWRVRRGIAQLSSPNSVGRLSYFQKLKNLFGSSLIGYWPGNEESGTNAVDYSGNGYDGTYTGVTLGQEGTGDGLTCPLYDGSTDYLQPPAGFRTAFNGAAGTLMVWVKMFSAAVWSDATFRTAFVVQVNGSNLVILRKSTMANQYDFIYIAGGTTKSVNLASQSSLNFIHYGITWDKAADQVKAYSSGAQAGTTQTGLGTWVGTPAATSTLVGAATTTPTQLQNGYLASSLCLNRAATPAEMATAAAI